MNNKKTLLCFIVALGVLLQIQNIQGFSAYGDEVCLDGHAKEHSSTESAATHREHHADCKECTSHARTGLMSLTSISTIYPISPQVSYIAVGSTHTKISGFLGTIFRPPIV